MPAIDIGIDLGTASSLVFRKGRGIVLKEPSVVVYDKDAEKIREIGEEAKQMIGKTAGNMAVIWPIRKGLITDYSVTEKMLKYFIAKAMGIKAFRKPRISICVPGGITEVEKKAIEEVTYQAGAREVYLLEAPLAAAVGAGIDIRKPCGNMIVDIGAGTTDIAVISLGGAVVSTSIAIAGSDYDEAIVRFLRKNHSLLVDREEAENIKIRIGTVFDRMENLKMEVSGRDVVSGLPKTVMLHSREIGRAMTDCTQKILEAVHSVLEKTPPELAADIVERGIVLTGGSALLTGIEAAIERKTGIQTVTAQDPVLAVAVGAGRYVEATEGM
ncbi:MAG: rod shape-determining protein [Lachnospiraceae bacterium]